MRSITRILAGAAVAAGVFGAGAAMAMGDAYTHGDRIYYYELPATTYYETYTYQPYAYETYTYQPYAYREYRYQPYLGYYDDPYHPYWSYRGPLGQGSGSDMRVGR